MNSAEKMRQRTLFPVANQGHIGADVPPGKVRARWTGEKRPPQRGEWYLSGPLTSAYYAPTDLTIALPIAELVEVEGETVERVVRVL